MVPPVCGAIIMRIITGRLSLIRMAITSRRCAIGRTGRGRPFPDAGAAGHGFRKSEPGHWRRGALNAYPSMGQPQQGDRAGLTGPILGCFTGRGLLAWLYQRRDVVLAGIRFLTGQYRLWWILPPFDFTPFDFAKFRYKLQTYSRISHGRHAWEVRKQLAKHSPKCLLPKSIQCISKRWRRRAEHRRSCIKS